MVSARAVSSWTHLRGSGVPSQRLASSTTADAIECGAIEVWDWNCGVRRVISYSPYSGRRLNRCDMASVLLSLSKNVPNPPTPYLDLEPGRQVRPLRVGPESPVRDRLRPLP